MGEGSGGEEGCESSDGNGLHFANRVCTKGKGLAFSMCRDDSHKKKMNEFEVVKEWIENVGPGKE